ncbi:MAG TPA: phospholipase C, phosphocholine-specific [Thermomicrobiaceae bacterium]|nr:phospholipase C, phosphocholine-specific [Thermomicrobiaceae bacterium]
MMSSQISRRRLLGSSAAVAAAMVAASTLPPALRAVLADDAPNPPDSLKAVDHVVFLIQENRSFDHYFGTMNGVRGFGDPTAITLSTGKPVWYQPDALNPDGYELPFHLDTTTTSAAAVVDLSHTWLAQHSSWNGGKMDNWLPAHRLADGNARGPMTMGYYTRADIPFHYALADAFTICDHYHCSVLGPTNPNRLYAFTGTIDPDGKNGGPVVDNSETPPYTWTTYPERLQQAGISWRVYQSADNYDDNPLAWFKQYQQAPTSSPLYQNGTRAVPDLLTAFRDDVQAGRLPQVSWLVPPAAVSEHPSYLPASGAYFTYQVLEALAAKPDVWNTTVVFFTYDENDGFFDHVPPPTAPAGTPGEYVGVSPLPAAAHGIAGPIGLGFRVPMIVISPWSRGGYANSEAFDHTSMLRFVETRFGVEETNISAWRRSTVGDLTSTLRLKGQGAPGRTFPTLPNPADSLQRQYIGSQDYPAPTVPANQTLPTQEAGSRPSD